ncbi:MAG: cell envelope integrity protein CreD [Janthinobacterium lividum]
MSSSADEASAAAAPFPPPAATPPPPWPALRRSPAGKVAALLVLLALLQVPLWMVAGLIGERADRHDQMLGQLRHGWGPSQVVAGPTLVVPYRGPPAADGTPGATLGWARLQPSRLQVTAALRPETRQRGLFRATVYTADLAMTGSFALPPLSLDEFPAAVPDWTRARVLVGVGDLRGIPADARLDWNGQAVPLEAADQHFVCGLATLAAPLHLAAAPPAAAVVPFATALTLQGTQGFGVVPLARQVALRVSSPWPTPSFTGGSLPQHQEHTDSGFTAGWDVAGPATERGWQPSGGCGVAGSIAALGPDAQLGVELQQAVPTYLMVERAAKYGTLFVALSFLTLFLFEVSAGVRVHLVQYGLIGLSVSLFALLLISVAEPLGFVAGYAISAAAVLAQASLYAVSVLRRMRLVVLFAAMLAALFGFLYVLLSLETYALLTGSLALFLLLSALMLATRRVGWANAAG